VIRQIKPLQLFWTIYFVEFANSALGIMETVELRQPSLPKTPGATSSCRRPFRKLKNEDRILSL
jgi:hypothetical protein